MILLDYVSGSHGHFLEYVINTWVYKGPRVVDPFTISGTAHQIDQNMSYMESRMVRAGHYTEFNYVPDSILPTKVIKISINQYWGNWIYQINKQRRLGDSFLKQTLPIGQYRALRNEWFARLNQIEYGFDVIREWRWSNIDTYDFPIESLFDIVHFYQELYRVAHFLNITFVPDADLANLHRNFLALNQGWQCFSSASSIVKHCLTGECYDFDSDEMSQAMINSLLNKCVGICDGPLFDQNTYPDNSLELKMCIEKHLVEFDQKF